jgi:hypothetical protein
MKRKLCHILLLAMILILSCDENYVIIKCSECLDSEPTEAKIIVKVEFTGGFQIMARIYEGNIGDSILLSTLIVNSNVLEYNVKINKTYTFCIEYTDSAGKKYFAINTVYPRVKFDLEQCSDFPCYYIYDNKLDMHLKYQ